tara:strand:+ start:7 stop:1689 length:1683 start_codon:yes stop_codon:yes gene_type:complete
MTIKWADERNAAILIQFFFYKKISKTKHPTKKLFLNYIKIRNERITRIFNDFKKELNVIREEEPLSLQNMELTSPGRRSDFGRSSRRKRNLSSIGRRLRQNNCEVVLPCLPTQQALNHLERMDNAPPIRNSIAFVPKKTIFRIICDLCQCKKDTSYDDPYSENRLYNILPVTYSLVQILSKRSIAITLTLFLIYHVFIYMYLGFSNRGSSLHVGFMYSTCYAGVIVSYWILYRQKLQMLDWTHILSNELILNFEERKGRPFSQYELIEQNKLYHLINYTPGHEAFVDYCRSWERLVKSFVFIWQACATIGIIIKYSEKWDNVFGHSFDNDPLALYGYYNLFGQYIASVIVLTSAATLFIGFYNLRCLILCYCGDIRKYRLMKYNPKNKKKDEKVKKLYLDLRDEYLYLQKCCVILGDVWTKPVIISSIFAIQVIISNIFVIQKQVEYCDEGCSLFIIFPIIWCFTGIYILHLILDGISSINESSTVIKQVFTYSTSALTENSNKGDYVVIGGRERWLNYIESNPIELKIGGTVVTKKYVINSISTIVVGVGSFALSNLLN